MKAIDLFHRKFVYNDLLALALAGIISLLFAQTAYGFFSTSYKKQEDQSGRQCYINQSYSGQSNVETDLITREDKLSALVETHEIFYALQFLRQNSLAKARKTKIRMSWCVKTQYSNVLPPVRRPYIPIAYCKLVI
jgi:hypothetical protein